LNPQRRAEIDVFGWLFLTVRGRARSTPWLETNVITWLLVLLIAVSVAILIAHAIDAMRS
jgi:hypothetical protein